MIEPEFTPIQATYQKTDQGLWVLNKRDVPLDFSMVADEQLIHLAPKAYGGNHQHPEIEWFVAVGDLELYWLNEKGVVQQAPMYSEGQLMLIQIPSLLPHAVRNESGQERGLLWEFANGSQRTVTAVQVI